MGHCLEHLLLDDQLWLESFEEDIAIDVSIPEETLNRVYTGLLMQEGMKMYLVSTATVKECNKNIPSSRSAFDTVDHNLLLNKCIHVREVVLSWVGSYQYVQINNNFTSQFQKVRCGVPQGSVLGLMLFCLGRV